MGLLGNINLLHKSPAKYTTGKTGFNDRANWNKPGMMRSRGDLTVSALWKYDAVPSGTYAGRAFFPPQKAGRIVSRTPFSIAATAVGAQGVPLAASASFAINAASVGGLIAGGVANATMTFTATGAIAGLAAGQASAAIQVTGNVVPGASAFGVATGTMTVSATSTAYGLAYGNATTADNTTLTPASIATAVWQSVLSEYSVSGTAGNALGLASSGGVDYSALGAAVWASVSRTLTAGDAPDTTEIANAVLAALNATTIPVDVQKMNGAELLGNGTAGNKWRG